VTPNLTVAGNAREGELKRILADLDAFRAAMSALFPGIRTTSPVPTRVVVFRDYDAFARFRPRDSRGKPQQNVGGYFTDEPEASFIVSPMSSQAINYATIFHEYAHYLIHRNARSFIPMWLNEGLAEFYSTFEPDYKGQSLLGRALVERVQALHQKTFMPLRDVVSPREMEKTWRSGDRISMFYTEAWALVHYLVVERKASISAYLQALSTQPTQDAAFREAFGVDVDGMERELRAYVSRIAFPALTMKRAAEVSPNVGSAPMLEADVLQLEGSLLSHVGATEDAEKALQAALALNPAHVDARVSLAGVRLVQDRPDEAIASLLEVTQAAPANLAAHYYLGVALEKSWRHEEAIAAFGRALKLNAAHTHSWAGLSVSALALNRDIQAAAALQQVRQLDSNPAFERAHAQMALRLGRNEAAAAAARSYINLVGWSSEPAQYASFLAAIASWRAGQAGDADAILSEAREVIPVKSWSYAVLQFLQGRLEPEPFLAMAADIGQKTEAHTYVGFKSDLAGRHDEALTHFRWVAEQGARTYVEYGLARNEIARMQHAATSK
jgi:tetratricopeptide (TPR) repeat protein